MQYHTHLAFGGMVGLAAAEYLPIGVGENDLILYGSGLLMGALLCDIDHPKSKISNKIPILPDVISLVFKHRTFFHSLLFLALLSLLYSVLPSILVTGLMIGVASHMLGDMMTSQGIQLFFPFGGYISLPLTFRTGGIVEQVLFLTFGWITYQIF